MIQKNLKELGLSLPDVAPALAAYIPAKKVGKLIYVSGQLPLQNGTLLGAGSVPEVCSVELAQKCAEQCFLNGLAVAVAVAGGVEHITELVQVSGFVQSATGFTQQPQVINGASELAVAIMGDAGAHTRAAVGVSSLPLNACVEIAFVFSCD